MNNGVWINLGSGHWKIDGWINVDIDRDSAPEVLADLATGLPFQDGVAALMHTEDFIDQLPLALGEAFLKECHRILAPGGVVRVLTPDLALLTRMYLEDPDRLLDMWNRFVGVPLGLETPGEVLNLGMRLSGRAFLYDADTFRELARRCGFEARAVRFNESEIPELQGLDLRSPDEALSMYFDCYKSD